jgi:uncharacterized protein (TIGR02391 family)
MSEKNNASERVYDFLLEKIKTKEWEINSKIIFEGIEIGEDGKARKVTKAKTVSEALNRSHKIKRKIGELNIHSEVIKFCEEEWLRDNYFHAILEITKSVAENLRNLSGYLTDGSELVDDCFGLGREIKPMLAFNSLQSPSEQSEHKGFANFLKGFFSMYRNPKAHNPRINEDTQLSELTEVLLIASIIFWIVTLPPPPDLTDIGYLTPSLTP